MFERLKTAGRRLQNTKCTT